MSNPHKMQPLSPLALIRNIWGFKSLILQMTKREVVGRYKGSTMGLAWSFLNPLFMLIVYTFVFSVVFKARWSVGGDESRTQFAVILFVGMIVHGFFAEVVNRAPQIILGNTNYVKKVVFSFGNATGDWALCCTVPYHDQFGGIAVRVLFV
jgi:lipopolysaccharide transport system permease protein